MHMISNKKLSCKAYPNFDLYLLSRDQESKTMNFKLMTNMMRMTQISSIAV